MTCKHSTASSSLATTYTGALSKLGQRHGKGELFWGNGDVYMGNFANDMREGHGTLIFAAESSGDGGEYVGEWHRNLMHGSGTWRYPNGEMYVGEYKAGKREGEGRFYHANGDLYVGSWLNNQMHGFGRYYFANGLHFEGTFMRNKRNGKGKLQREDGTIEVFQYINNERVGQGVRWSADRSKAWRLWIPSKRYAVKHSAVTYEKKAIPVAEAVSLVYEIERSADNQDHLNLSFTAA